MRLLVIIPAFNEAECIDQVINQFLITCPDVDFIIINDGSSDDTANICQRKGYPILNLPVNLGLTGAFITGMKYAYLNHYDAALQFDADGQHPAASISEFEKYLNQGYDIVIGSRFVTEKKPRSLRMLGSNIISWAILITTGKRLGDPTSGMRMYNKRMIREYATQMNMDPEPDTVSYLIKRGALVKEIQVSMQDRIAGSSYLTTVKSLIYMTRVTISILLVQRFRGGNQLHPEHISVDRKEQTI